MFHGGPKFKPVFMCTMSGEIGTETFPFSFGRRSSWYNHDDGRAARDGSHPRSQHAKNSSDRLVGV